MNNRQLYIAWLRTKFPQHYIMALRKVTGKPRSLGGLGDDLMLAGLGQDIAAFADSSIVPQDMFSFSNMMGAPDPNFSVVPAGSYDNPIPEIVVTGTNPFASGGAYMPGDSAAPAQAASPSFFSNLPNLFGNFVNAVAGVAMTSMATKSSAQSQLLATNTARAQRGQGPVDANGVPITAASLAPARGSLYALEQRLAGGGMSSWLMLGGIGLAAYMFLSRRRK